MESHFKIVLPEDEEVVGFTLGIFDGLHAGHLHLFEQCLRYCDRLVVGVLTDQWASKNKRWPLFTVGERMDAIGAYYRPGPVDVTPCASLDVIEPMKGAGATHFFHGNDWLEDKTVFDKTLPEKVRLKIAKEGFTTILVPYFKAISSSEILKRAKGRE